MIVLGDSYTISIINKSGCTLMSETNKRLTVPDTVKGLAVLGVLLTHFYMSPTLETSTTTTGISAIPMQLLYLMLMAFFVIAGYFYRPRGFVHNVRIRVLRLSIAYVLSILVLPLLMYGYFSIRGYEMDFTEGYLVCLKSLIGNYVVMTPMGTEAEFPDVLFYTNLGYYFINLIIVASILFYAVVDLAMKDERSFAIWTAGLVLATAVICAVSPIHLPFQLELVPISAAFMIFGTFLSRRKFIENLEEGGLSSKRMWTLLFGSLVAAFLIALVFPLGKGFHYAYFGTYGGWSAIPYFFAGLSISVCALCMGLLFSRIPIISTYLSFIGQHSFAILLLHVLLGKAIGYLMSDEIGMNYCAVLNLPQAIFLIIAVSIISSYLGKFLGGIYMKMVVHPGR